MLSYPTSTCVLQIAMSAVKLELTKFDRQRDHIAPEPTSTLFWFVAKYKVAADTSFFSELLTPIGAAAVRCTFFATKEIKIHMKSISISGELMTRFVCHRSFAPAISRFVGG
uniref:AlNc14C16G1777 protein n=1 Tax=Albugo laibachii Nc14 TaxID=890382 RepID=F0W4A6_9STRA|nr:AlNc14C16G1777 [Albugo laibachii Nc14]|eukprot:CCA15939.1 AlNc14C16G1777 [Albugo laibachii Nc14]